MLIICHKDHRIHHFSLLLNVVKSIMGCRCIIIYRYNQFINVCFNGQFPQKLQIRCRIIFRHMLKVDIDTVQIILDRFSYQTIDQLGTAGGRTKNLAQFDAFLKVVHKSPYLFTGTVSLSHIPAVCQ